MRIAFDKFDLTPALDLVEQAVNEKSPLDIYKYLLMDATEEGDIFLRSNDGTMGLEAKVAGDVDEAGSYAVPAKKILDLSKTLAGDKKINITGQPGNRILIESGKGKYRIPCLPSSEFPTVMRNNERKEEETLLSINGEQFRSAIDQTIFAAAIKEDRNLNSICLNFMGSKFEAVGADGVLMSRVICEPKETDSIDERKLLVPIESAKHARRVFNSAYDLTIWQRDSTIVISDDTNTLSTRLLAGVYAPYDQIFASKHEHEAEIDRMALIALLKRASILATLRKGNMISMSIRPKTDVTTATIGVSVKIAEEGEADDVMDIQAASAPVDINFDCDLLLKVLGGMKSKAVKMKYTDEKTWAVYQSTETEVYGDQTCLIPPMQSKVADTKEE